MAPIRTDFVWDPRKTLDLYPSKHNFLCVGRAVTMKNSGCRWDIDQRCCVEAETILDAMEELEPKSDQIAGYLDQLATRLLCTAQHQKQAEEKVYQWSRKVNDVAVQLKKERKMQSQIHKLKEELHESKELLKSQSSGEVQRLENQLAEKTQEVDHERSKLEGMSQELDQKRSTLVKKSDELEHEKSKCKEISKELDYERNELGSAYEELEELQTERTALASQVADLQAQLADSQSTYQPSLAPPSPPASQPSTPPCSPSKTIDLTRNGQTQTAAPAPTPAKPPHFDFQVDTKLTSTICARDRTITELKQALKKVDAALDTNADNGPAQARQDPFSGTQWLGHIVNPPPPAVLKISLLKDQVRELTSDKAGLAEQLRKLETGFDEAEGRITKCNVSTWISHVFFFKKGTSENMG